jgi:hypothetical protein
MALGITAFGVQNLSLAIYLVETLQCATLDAAVRYWGYIGYVFGVAEDTIPKTFKEGV